MADEILYGHFLYVKKGSRQEVEIPLRKKYADMTGDIYRAGQQEIGTNKENIDKPTAMGTIGFIYIENLDSTNFVEIGDDADNPSLKLLAGQSFMGPWGATNVSCKADAAAVLIEFVIIEL